MSDPIEAFPSEVPEAAIAGDTPAGSAERG